MQTIPFQTDAPTVTDRLAVEHARLDDLIAWSVTEDLELVRRRFVEVSRNLRDHMRIEEELLFPVLEREVCHLGGRVCMLRREHRDIEDQICAVAAALYLGDVHAFRTERDALIDMLDRHNRREEDVLYPMIDRVLEPGARAALLAELHRRL